MNCLPLLDSCCIALSNECAWCVYLEKIYTVFLLFVDFFLQCVQMFTHPFVGPTVTSALCLLDAACQAMSAHQCGHVTLRPPDFNIYFL